MHKRLLGLIVAAGSVLLIGLAAPAVAQDREISPDTPASNQNQGSEPQDRGQGMSQQARDFVDQVRNRAEARRVQVRTDVCQRRENQLNQLIPNLSTNATTLLDEMDTMYERVQQFYTTGQLAVDNYDSLKAGVDTTQAEAASAVQGLKEYEFNLNCDDPQTGNQMDSFRIAANEAREDLANYRTELVTLISSLRAEAATNSEDAEEEQQ